MTHLNFFPIAMVCVWQRQTTALKSLSLEDFRFSFKINILIHLHFYLFACALCICHFSFAMTHTFPTSFRYSLSFVFFLNKFSSSHLVFSFFFVCKFTMYTALFESVVFRFIKNLLNVPQSAKCIDNFYTCMTCICFVANS